MPAPNTDVMAMPASTTVSLDVLRAQRDAEDDERGGQRARECRERRRPERAGKHAGGDQHEQARAAS